MIRCAEVRKTYRMGDRSVEALRGLNLAIEEPGFYAIMGQSGSGKSTLLHLLAALDQPDSGEVSVAGRDLSKMNEREATEFRRRDIGIVFQGFNLIPTLTAGQNVELPGMLAGEKDSWLRERREELLSRLGLEGRSHHRPDALSGGEQQRVAIARSLLFQPQVLLADEPTGNLDSESSAQLWRLLDDISREHEMTIAMVTHEPVAAAHCKRVFVIRDGVVCGEFENDRDHSGREIDAGGVATRYQQLIGQA